MKNNNLYTVGGLFAILLGLTKIVSAAGYLIIPADQRAAVGAAKFLPSYAAGHTLLNTVFWAEALVGVFGLAVVPAVSALVISKKEGWVTWAKNLALVGFAVTAIGYMLTISRVPGIAKAFVAGDASTKAALAVTWKSSPDLFGFWGYGAIGIWVLVISLLMLDEKHFPKALNFVGLILALLYFLVPIGTYFKYQPLLLAAAGLGLIFTPLWYIWVGVRLRGVQAAPE